MNVSKLFPESSSRISYVIGTLLYIRKEHVMKNYVFGNARVSTEARYLDRQLDAHKKYGVDQIYNEKMTGTKKDRPELAKLIDRITEGGCCGDRILVTPWKNTKDLIELTGVKKSALYRNQKRSTNEKR